MVVMILVVIIISTFHIYLLNQCLSPIGTVYIQTNLLINWLIYWLIFFYTPVWQGKCLFPPRADFLFQSLFSSSKHEKGKVEHGEGRQKSPWHSAWLQGQSRSHRHGGAGPSVGDVFTTVTKGHILVQMYYSHGTLWSLWLSSIS